MSDFFYDALIGADGTLADAHTANFGGGYVNLSGNPFLDGNGRFRSNGAANAICKINTTPPSADYAYKQDIVHLDIQTDQNWHMMVRCSSDGTTRYALYYDANLHSLNVGKWVSNAFTSLGFAAFTPTAGTTSTFVAQANGTTLTFTRNGTNILAPITDSAITAAGVPAFVIQGANTGTTGMRMSNIHVAPIGAFSTALAVGTPTVNSQTGTTASLTSTGASGGIPSYTYQWHRSTTSGFTPSGGTAISGATGLTVNDSGLTPGTTYYYVIVATDAGSTSVASVQTPVSTAALATGTISQVSVGSTTASLTSTSATGGSTPYVYAWYRSTTNGFTPGAGNVLAGQTGTTLSDSGLSASTTYYYVLKTTDATSTSVLSNQLPVITTAIAGFSSATVASGGGQVVVVFSSSISAPAITDFIIVAGTKPLKIASVSGATTTWTLTLDSTNVIVTGQAVSVSYIGAAVTTTKLTATNNSTLHAKAQKFIDQGFGIFFTWGSSVFTAPGGVSQATMNSVFTPTSYNMDQWLDAALSAGARYCVLTTKHDGGFCLWPTASGGPHVGATPWYSSGVGADVVKDFTTKCRARGMGVGLYINFYDPWWAGIRSGSTANIYTGPGSFTTFMSTQLTELLTNYGVIDMLWADSWEYRTEIGYTNANYATIRALITSLQPNCVLVNNAHTSNLSHSDIAVFEGDGVQAEPSSNTLPAEFDETNRADIQWAWQASGENVYKDPYAIAARVKRLSAIRCNYLLNFAPNNLGLLPASNITWAALLGSIIGTQGSTVLPLPANIKSGVDRGDGVIGTRGSGINGTSILGMI